MINNVFLSLFGVGTCMPGTCQYICVYMHHFTLFNAGCNANTVETLPDCYVLNFAQDDSNTLKVNKSHNIYGAIISSRDVSVAYRKVVPNGTAEQYVSLLHYLLQLHNRCFREITVCNVNINYCIRAASKKTQTITHPS